MKRRVEIIDGHGRIEAALGERTGPRDGGYTWAGELGALKALGNVADRLVPSAVFDAELTVRWARLVVCTPEFSAWWRAQAEAPAPLPSFFLEVEDV